MFRRVEIEGGDVARALVARSREPFTEALAVLIGCQPSGDRLAEWARDYPDRWGSMVAQMARLAGYPEKQEVRASVGVSAMSDVEIEARLREALGQCQGATTVPTSTVPATKHS